MLVIFDGTPDSTRSLPACEVVADEYSAQLFQDSQWLWGDLCTRVVS